MIDYQSIGSGGGIQGITDKTVHFLRSDAPMSKKELEAAGGADKHRRVSIVCGRRGADLQLAGRDGVAEVHRRAAGGHLLGQGDAVERSGDRQAQSGRRSCPNSPITPVWRTDGSGTTFIFTNYLATQSDELQSTIGMGKQVQWPFGQGGKGNEGVTAVVQQTVGGLGTSSRAYADNNQLTVRRGAEQRRQVCEGVAESVSAAGAGAAGKMHGQVLAADIWNQPGEQAYPISSFTYLIVYKDLQESAGQGIGPGTGEFSVVGDARRAAVCGGAWITRRWRRRCRRRSSRR